MSAESQVAERERLLTALDRRSTQLQTAAEISRAASSILNLDELLPLAVGLIRDRFSLYYSGIFLLDVSGQWAILRAAAGEAAQQMLEADHKLKVDGSSMIGWCITYAKLRFALDVGKETVRFQNPLLPGTRSEAALPLLSQGRVIGAMTIQSDQVGSLTEEDFTVFQTIADQIAVAVENARLHTAEKDRARELEQAHQALRDNQQRLLMSEKMASLGRLTAGIAHEMNTPIAAVRASLSELDRLAAEYQSSVGEPQVTPDDHLEIAKEMKESIRLAKTAAERAARFVRGIKNQARDLGPADKQLFNAVLVIKEALLLLGHALRKSNCTALFEPVIDNIGLYGSPSRLAQVVTNLVTNSIDASIAKGGGKITVSLTPRNNEIELQVVDTGTGIAPQNAPKIFESTFTTKPLGEGTGLGLEIVHGIVTGEFGGTIRFSTEVGQGTTFLILFPTHKEFRNAA